MKTIQKILLIGLLMGLLVITATTLALAQAEVTCESDYIVQPSDSLTKIAVATYGSGNYYPAIVAATNQMAASDSSYATIKNTNIVVKGWKLCLPSAEAAQALVGPTASPAAPVAPEPVVSEPVAPAPGGDLTLDQLANATYSGIYTYPVTLTDGKFEGEPFVEGGASRPTVTLVDDLIAYGDLNGDGLNDAAVLLVENSGGSGVFTYVGAQLNQNGQPVDAGAVRLGDRVQIKSMAIQNGQVVLEMIIQGPNDPQCCATLKVRNTYALQDNVLAQAGSEELGNVSLADLAGTGWTLVELDRAQPVAAAVPPLTAEFTADQISGSAGCNTYNAAISSGGAQSLTVGPIITTRMACPEPAMTQETQYLAALQMSTQWGYQAGQLALVYSKEDGNIGSLLYAPSAPAAPVVSVSVVTTTEVITFTPPTIPTETQPGSCFTNAIGLGREDAYRCMVDNQIYDPCFVVDDKPTVVCEANPTTGETGFVLELTEPLPAPEAGNLSQPWLVELADGTVCGLMTGTVPGVGDRIAPYGCPDRTYLFDDFQQGQVWMAEKVVIELGDNGFTVKESEMTPLSTVWY